MLKLSEMKKQLSASRKSNDTESPFDRFVHDPIALVFSRLFIRLRIKPNAITLLSMAFGVTGALFFISHNWWVNFAGVLLQIFAAILDCCDGQVARLTKQTSRLGRVLDGTCDTVNFAAVYLALGIRMMGEPIPFAQTNWGFWIWPIVLFASLVCHAGQCRMADYYRLVHLHFLEPETVVSFPSAADLRAEVNTPDPARPRYETLFLRSYATYTAAQERACPRLQRLLNAIRSKGTLPLEVADAYLAESRKIVQITNLLTFNLRAYTLYILLLLGWHVWFFPFLILGLEALAIFMVRRYEAIAANVWQGMMAAARHEEVTL